GGGGADPGGHGPLRDRRPPGGHAALHRRGGADLPRRPRGRGGVTGPPADPAVAVLIYRADLGAEGGYGGPPQTWDELEAMAARIQARQRAAGNDAFWGLSRPGKAAADLLCFARGLQAPPGAGGIVDGEGRVTVNNPRTRAALLRARRWIG